MQVGDDLLIQYTDGSKRHYSIASLAVSEERFTLTLNSAGKEVPMVNPNDAMAFIRCSHCMSGNVEPRGEFWHCIDCGKDSKEAGAQVPQAEPPKKKKRR